MCAQRRVSAAARAPGSRRGGGGEKDAEPARPRARPLAPPGPRVGTHAEGKERAAGERRGVVRPTLSPPLPEPPPPPSVSFPHKPAQVRQPRRRARVQYCGQRSLMTSRTAPRPAPPPAGSWPRERPLGFWPAPPLNLGGPGAPARKSRREKAAKAKTKNKFREADGNLVEGKNPGFLFPAVSPTSSLWDISTDFERRTGGKKECRP
nr:PREDICTED: CCAAT/enhancer-binding protein alpha-like [Macaca fascicularis]